MWSTGTHYRSTSGVEADPSKVAAIVDWPVPRNVAVIRSFVRPEFRPEFQHNCGTVVRPDEKGSAFQVSECFWASWAQDHLGRTPCSTKGRWKLWCLRNWTRAVLQEWQDGLLCVDAYASWNLTPAEKVYCTVRKEQLARVYGLKQFWPRHIFGHRTVVRSDHAALIYLIRA